ncbi:DUF2247 family protein [Sporosarcina sp. FSL W7-1349]|uniref:DUF2247 family protein n=1 Tax=Sporosarcina sp. FSL W7-1349 TaxID=2921561 RepID=UPI0030F64D6E
MDLDADVLQIQIRNCRFALLADDLEELLNRVAEVYAVFDYPKDMESFINYLPPSDGFDPFLYTKEENEIRLIT